MQSEPHSSAPAPAIGPVKAVAFIIATAATIAASIAMPSRATAAEDIPGFYGTLRTGKAWVSDMGFNNPVIADLELDADSAGSIGGAIGYRFTGPFRADFTLDYLNADFDGSYREFTPITIPCGESPGTPCLGPGVDGDFKALSGFAMGYYDMPVTEELSTYVGAGLGLMRQNVDVSTRARLNDGTSTRYDIIDDKDTTVGYRVAAGLGYDIGMAIIDVGYSYTTASRGRFAATGSGVQDFDLEPRLKSHSIDVALRFDF